MDLTDFLIEGCKTSDALEALPKKHLNLDLSIIAKNIEKQGIQLEINTPMLLIFKFKGKPVSIYKHGKLIFKEITAEKEAKELLSELLEIIKLKE